MKLSPIAVCVLAILSSMTFADEPKGKDEPPMRAMSMSVRHTFTLTFEKAKIPQEGLTGIKLVMDGKALPLVKPGAAPVEDFKLVDAAKAKNGPANMELVFEATKGRTNSFVLFPVYEKGREGKAIANLKIHVKE